MLAIQLERSFDGLDGPRFATIAELHCEGTQVRSLPSGGLMLEWLDGRWWYDGEDYSGLTIETRTQVCAQRVLGLTSTVFGPFDFMRLSGGALCTSPDGEEELARLDPTSGQWRNRDGARWSRLVLMPTADAKIY